MSGIDSDDWVTNKPKITDSAILKRIEQALKAGPIYIRHALYHGGGNPHWDTATRYQQFLDHLTHSNAGDWFYVWSIPKLIQEKLPFFHGRYEKFDLSSEEATRDFLKIKEFLNKGDREVFGVFIPSKPHDPKAVFQDLDGYGDFCNEAQGFSGRPLELYAFDMEVLWNPEHLLVDAKFPNAKGEVPVNGSY